MGYTTCAGRVKRTRGFGSLRHVWIAACACILGWMVIPEALPATSDSAWGQSAASDLQGNESRQRAGVAGDPTSPELHGVLGQTLLQEGKYEEAVKEFGIAAQQLPDSLVYNMGLAEALIGWGHFGVAEEVPSRRSIPLYELRSVSL